MYLFIYSIVYFSKDFSLLLKEFKVVAKNGPSSLQRCLPLQKVAKLINAALIFLTTESS